MAFKKNPSSLVFCFTCQIDFLSMMYEYRHTINELGDDTLDLDKLIGRQLLLFVVLSLNGVVPKRIVFLSVFFSLSSLFLSLSLFRLCLNNNFILTLFSFLFIKNKKIYIYTYRLNRTSKLNGLFFCYYRRFFHVLLDVVFDLISRTRSPFCL
jgi:hypothetical protein